MSPIDRAALRHLFRTNPFAVKIKSSLLNNLIGYGITGTVAATKSTQTLWSNWIAVCDFDGVHDLYGLQAMIAETWMDDGEVFVVRHIVLGAAVHPLRLQVLDIDMLDQAASAGRDGNRVVGGIEYDEDGRPVAYWFRRSREIATFGNARRVPADDVIHLFHRQRPGQWRGRPIFESVLDVLNDVDDYLEAEGVRKKISACFVGFRAPSTEMDDPAMGKVEDSDNPGSPPDESFYPGMIINGRPGETMTFGDPKVDAGIGEFMRWSGLRMTAGAQTTYERGTGDLSNVNYSSYKAGDLEFQRFVGRLQWLLFIPRLLNRISGWWVDAGYQTGLIGARAPKFKWTPPPFGSVDEGKDIKAKREQMAALVESPRNVAAERGYDFDELTTEIAEDLQMLHDKLEAKGLIGLLSLLGGKSNTPGGSDGGNQNQAD